MCKKLINKLLLTLLLFYTFPVAQILAQSLPDSSFTTPYFSLQYFLYFQEGDHADLGKSARIFGQKTTSKEAENLAYQLKATLNGRGLRIPMERVPKQPDFLDSATMEHKYQLFPDRLPDIFLEKNGDRWYMSEYSQLMIPKLYEATYPYLVIQLKEWLPGRDTDTFGGIKVWQWIGLLSLLPALALLYLALYYLCYLITHLLSDRYIHELREKEARKKRLARFTSLWLVMGLFLLFFPSLMFSVQVNSAVIATVQIVRTIILIFVFLKASDIVFLYVRKYVENTPGKLDDQVLPIVEKLVDFIIILGGIFYILNQLDVNITALIAGVSIGGLALALAAQDTVKNIIGSAMIFIDKPFQVGDYIETSQYAGTVEEVGFRSVRLRNIDRSVISVPNGNVANDTIVNLGLRPMRRIQLTIGITYNTPPDHVQLFVETLRQMVERHPNTSKTDYLIYFHDLGASSFNIFFRVYIFAATFAEELAIREELVFGIIELAENIGVSFAFPSTSVYIEQNTPSKRTPLNSNEKRTDASRFLDAFESKVKKQDPINEDSGT
jgi:MscS family membrane protein